MNPKENLPQQICDLCIVQLNVSYNFKRLALKNDFQIRQYMIENGMSLTKDDDDSIETTTALEIHQIQHNVIRTNRYRQIAAPEIRRNSTTSSVSGASTMMINGRENDATSNNTANNFVTPRPMVRPMQIKIEPVDPDEAQQKDGSPATSSLSNASEPASVVTIYSSTPSEKPSPPMIKINGIVNNDSFNAKKTSTTKSSAAAPLSVKLTRKKLEAEKKAEKLNSRLHNLRTIHKEASDLRKSKRKIVEVLKKREKAPQKQNAKAKNVKNLKKSSTVKVVNKQEMKTGTKPRGRPPKIPGTPKMTYKKRTQKVDRKRS